MCIGTHQSIMYLLFVLVKLLVPPFKNNTINSPVQSCTYKNKSMIPNNVSGEIKEI